MRNKKRTPPIMRLAHYWREARILSKKLENGGQESHRKNRQARLAELNEKRIPETVKEIEEEILNGKK